MSTKHKRFFHTMDEYGTIDKQGVVLSNSHGRVTVEFFSWIDGAPNGCQTFDQEDTNGWRFYDSQRSWLSAGDNVFSKSPDPTT